MIVYVVVRIDWQHSEVIEVFDTLEEAQAYARMPNAFIVKRMVHAKV